MWIFKHVNALQWKAIQCPYYVALFVTVFPELKEKHHWLRVYMFMIITRNMQDSVKYLHLKKYQRIQFTLLIMYLVFNVEIKKTYFCQTKNWTWNECGHFLTTVQFFTCNNYLDPTLITDKWHLKCYTRISSSRV